MSVRFFGNIGLGTTGVNVQDEGVPVLSPAIILDFEGAGVTATVEDPQFPVGGQETSPSGVAFKTDGTKMFVVGGVNNAVFEYDLSIPFDVTSAVYNSNSFSVGSEDTNPFSVTFRSNGTKMFICGEFNKTIFEYDLGTAWDVTSAVFNSNSFLVSSQDTNPFGVAFKMDGTKMFVVGDQNKTVFEYDLGTAWDVTSAVFNGSSFLVSGQDATPISLTFKPDGTKMFLIGVSSVGVFEYDLGTPWDITSAVFNSIFFSVIPQETTPTGIALRSDGTEMFIVGLATDTVFSYTLETPWSLSTAVFSSDTVTVEIPGAGALNYISTAVNLLTAGQEVIGVNDTSALRTITVSTADITNAAAIGKPIIVKDESGAAQVNNITVDTEGAETIDAVASVAIAVNHGVIKFYSDGSNLFTT